MFDAPLSADVGAERCVEHPHPRRLSRAYDRPHRHGRRLRHDRGPAWCVNPSRSCPRFAASGRRLRAPVRDRARRAADERVPRHRTRATRPRRAHRPGDACWAPRQDVDEDAELRLAGPAGRR